MPLQWIYGLFDSEAPLLLYCHKLFVISDKLVTISPTRRPESM
jgi:hypothetical protein